MRKLHRSKMDQRQKEAEAVKEKAPSQYYLLRYDMFVGSFDEIATRVGILLTQETGKSPRSIDHRNYDEISKYVSENVERLFDTAFAAIEVEKKAPFEEALKHYNPNREQR